jgi:two-component sensor histidine kinase
LTRAADDVASPAQASTAEVATSAPRAAAVSRLTGALLIAGFIALLALVGVGIILNARAERSFDAVLAARNLSSVADGLRAALQAAEASERGYIITANQIYLAPYITAKADVLQRSGDLQDATRNLPETEGALARLRTLVAEKLNLMDQVVEFQRAGQGEQARALIETNRGKALMDEANIFLMRFMRLGDEQLRTAAEEQRRGLATLRTVNTVAAALITVAVGAVVWIIAAFARTLARSRDEVERLNSGLEQRVAIRTAELAAARDRAELLMAEVNHRVANSLALVASMIKIQARGTKDAGSRDLLNEIHDRVSAVALVHRRLYASNEVNSVDLADFLSALVDQLGTMMRESGHRGLVTHEVAPIVLPTDKSVSLGVVTAELVTNAFKYAYPSEPGEIRVRLERWGTDQAVLTVADDGVGRVDGATPKGTGLGSRLVAAMVGSLDGRLDYLDGGPGTVARITFPI